MKAQRQYSLVARSYAEALFRSARQQGILQRVAEECKTLVTVLGSASQRLRVFLGNPRVPTQAKFDLLNKALGPRFSPLTVRLVQLLVERERTESLAEILDLLIEKVEQSEGIYQAEVQTAFELGFQDKLRLKTSLEAYTGNKLRIDYGVDPSLIGGVVFRYRDTLIDGSLRAGLDNLRRRMHNTTLTKS